MAIRWCLTSGRSSWTAVPYRWGVGERWNAMARANKAAIEEADNAYNVALQKLSGINPDPEDVEAMVAALTHKNEVEAAVPNVRTFFKDLINELGDEGAGVGGLG